MVMVIVIVIGNQNSSVVMLQEVELKRLTPVAIAASAIQRVDLGVDALLTLVAQQGVHLRTQGGRLEKREKEKERKRK